MKGKLFFILAGASLVLGGTATGLALSQTRKVQSAQAIDQDGDYYLIKDATDFRTVFDGSAVYSNRKIRLVNDIDLTDLNHGSLYEWTGHGIAGSFSGEFDGNGKQISGFTMGADMDFFNEVNENAVIHDLTIVGTPRGSIYAPMTFWAYGEYSNVTSVVHMNGDFNTINGFVRVASNAVGGDVENKFATFDNCATHYVFDKDLGNTFRSLYGETRKNPPVVTDCIYTVSGLADSYTPATRESKVAAQGATYKDNVVGVEKIDNMTVAAGSNSSTELVTYGTVYSSISVTSSDTTKATVANDGLEVTVTGVAAGDATITVDFTTAEGHVIKTFDVTVEGAAVVTAVELDQDELSVFPDEEANLTATLTGNVYLTAEWTTSDASIAAVTKVTDTSAKVTGVATGSATITYTVDVDGSTTKTATCAVTVKEGTFLEIRLLVPKETYYNSNEYWSNVYGFPYGSLPSKMVTLSKVQSNGQDVKFRMMQTAVAAETPHEEPYEETWELWAGRINISGLVIDYGNAWIQFYNQTEGRWGAGAKVGSDGGVYGVGYKNNSAYVDFGWTVENVNDAVEFAGGNIYSGTWRTSEDICSYADKEAVVTAYNALSEGAKAVANKIDDATTAYEHNTLGDTISMFALKVGSGSGTQMIINGLNKESSTILIIITSISVVTFAIVALFVIRKRKHAQF